MYPASAQLGAALRCALPTLRRRGFADGSARREAVFLAGMPGSGKTRVIERRYGLLRTSGESAQPNTVVLNLDREIKAHPRYDARNRAAIFGVEGAYEWADARVGQRFLAAVQERSVARIVLDGTSGNTDIKVARRAERMDAARAAGMWVKLLYVRVTLETAMRRNARRERVVPMEALLRYEHWAEAAVEMVRPHADEVEIIDNDEDAMRPA